MAAIGPQHSKKRNLGTRGILSDLFLQFLWTRFKVKGVSEYTEISKSALSGRGINNFIEVWFLVASGGVEICVSSNSFQKNDIGWPQQPPTERVSDVGEKLDFWWSITKKGASVGHFGAGEDPTIRITSFFLWNRAFEGAEASEVAEADEVNPYLRIPEPYLNQIIVS